MAVNNFHFNVDIEKEDYIPKCKLKQYDTAIFYASLYKNGLPYHFEGEKIKMFVKKADGTIVYQEDNITIQDDEVKINVKNQALTASGLTYAELELKSSTGQVTTATFLFEVREKVGSDKAIESITDICTLEKIDRYVGQAKKELDKFKQDLSKLEDLVANKDKLEGQNTEAKINVKELERVLEQANNIVDNGGKKVTGNNVISESSNGYIQNLKLTGKTLVNIIPLNPSKWVLGGSGENLGKNAYYSIYLSDLPIKPNTTYTYKLFGLPEKCNSHWFHLTAPKITKSTQGTFTSLSEIGNSFLHLYPNGDQKFTLDDIKNVKVVLVEGNEKIDGYFEGLKSVGDGVDNIVIKSYNLNLFDEKLLSSKLEADGYYHFKTTGNNKCDLFIGFVDENYKQITDMTPNSVLDLSKFYLSNWRFLIGLNGDVKDDKVLIPVEQIGFLNTKFFKGCEFTKVDNNHIKVKNIELSLNKATPSYIPHEESKRNILYYDSKDKVWKKPVLRGIPEGVKDIIEKHSNGKIYYRKKCMEFTINGSENWVFDGDVGNTIRCYLRNSNIRPGLVASERLNSIQNYVLDKEHIYSSDKLLWIFLNKSKATDLNTFKNYFKGTPTTVVYPMIKEEVYECLDISTMSFNPQTLLSINSGVIDPGIEYYIPSSFVSSDNSITEKLENVDNSLLKLMFGFLGHKHDSRYERIDLGTVKDFNTALTPGKYWVAADDKIPNGPYGGGIWGYLEVSSTSETETAQIFTSSINGSKFFRLLNFQGNWTNWIKTPVVTDFVTGNVEGKHYAIFPNGLMIQWGNLILNFPGGCNHTKGYVYFPKTFTSDFIFTGSLARNNWAGYSETIAVLAEDNSSRGFVEARCIDSSVHPTSDKTVTINWIAIGRY